MKKLGNRCNKQMMRRIASAVLALVLVFGMIPTSVLKAEAHWTDEYIQTLVDWGVMRGDVSGSMNADKAITRAEFVAMVNRAFGYTADTTHPFTDVQVQDWFNNDIGMAYNMGYFKGTGETTASPNSSLTREQAVVLIGRNLLLDEKLGEALGFSDSRTFGDWSRGMVESAISAGFISGYDDGSFQPQRQVTRGEVAAMLVKAIGTMVNKSGTHELGGVYGNVMISSSGVKLKNTTIAGDLYITGGLELGDVMLENVDVLGKIIVSGAGESHKGDSSIVLRNVEAGELVLDSIADQFVTLRAEGNTQIDFTNVKTSAYLDDQTEVGDGLLYIEMNGGENMNVSLSGNIEEVLNRTANSALMIAEGTAQIVTVDEKAVDSTLEINNIASIETLNLDVGTPVTGEGSVKDVFVNAAGSVVDMLPDKITIRPGLTADINGEEMDTKEGNESSSEPRILSSYPKIKNLAPNSVEVVYSTNKKGTIHWALTSLIDGPVKVEDLLEVKDYNTKILQQGTISVTEANKEFKVKISKLLADGSYYVSAVLVDSRDQKSPVKYITFTTPDSTAPAFATGYPELTQIKKDNAQVAVMPTKNSVLYYAVLPKGAAAPTISEFKTGAISGDLGNCPEDGIAVKKNIITLKELTDQVLGKDPAGQDIILKDGKLEELKSYDLYLCLIDPDNGKDSGVKKIAFTTVDGTPPILADAMVTGIQKNNINLTTSMNEVGTIYWVAVKEDQEYPVPPSGTTGPVDLSDKVAQLQVINGMGNVVSSGKVNAQANKDVTLKVTKLEPESGYKIYYVAQDKAGNLSAVKMIKERTLDVAAPTVRQEFTKTADEAGIAPLSETDVKLIFSEDVQLEDGGYSFHTMYTTYLEAEDGDTKDAAKKELVDALKKSVQLWDVSVRSSTYQIEHDKNATGSGAWINFEKIEMEIIDTGELVVTFRNGKAINLGSGSTYQFILEDLTDTSNNRNPMKPNPFKMDEFTTVFAQVNLTKGLSAAKMPLKREYNSETKEYNFVLDKNEKTEARVDMSFRMDPQSTSSVNEVISYDIWFEANQLIYFDLYCRILTPEGTTQPEYSMFAECVDDTNRVDENGWMYLGNIKIGGSASSMARASVNGLIKGVNTTEIPQLNGLREDYTYEFVVEVTGFGTETGYGSWSQEAKLNVVIPAGQNLSSADYTRPNPWNDEIKNIGNPEIFTISRKFIDIQTPKFRDGYPLFDAGESRVDIKIMLDRPGELHYVVAPLSGSAQEGYNTSVATTIIKKDGDTQTVIPFNTWFKKADLTATPKVTGTPPSSGENLYVNSANPYGFGENVTMQAPTNDGVVLLVEDGASSTEIKTGKASVNNTLYTLVIGDDLGEGLEPLTTYLVYCVLKGESQEYSDVYCFQFTTAPVTVPTIELNRVNGAVWATTSTPANMDWAVYSTSMAAQNFGQAMYTSHTQNLVAPDKLDDFEKIDGYATMTVLQALETSIDTNDKRSIFDVYANETLKKQVLELIQMETSSSYDPTDNGDAFFEVENERQKITPQNLSSPTVYYFVAAACNAKGDTYGFKAVGGLRVADATAPDYINFNFAPDALAADPATAPSYKYNINYNNPPTGGYTAQYLGSLVYRGSVQIDFNEKIYMLRDDDDSLVPTPIDITKKDTNGNYTEFMNNIRYSDGLIVGNVSLTGDSIKFYVWGAKVGSSITLFNTGSICDAYGNVKGNGARLVLTFNVGASDMGFLEGFVQPYFEIKWVYN